MLALAAALLGCGPANAGSSSVVSRSGNYVLSVSDERVSQFRARDLLGVHSLWWGHAEGLFIEGTQRTHGAVVELLKNSGGVIRYGGGANEISWRACAGAVAQRKPVKAVPWAGPMRCRFGIEEYVGLLREFRADTTWMIANLVGEDYVMSSDAALRDEVGAGAAMLATVAGDSRRYWELGNELERGRYRWSSGLIAARASIAGAAIAAHDPTARLVLPMIEYDEGGQPPRRIFNERLLKATRQLPLSGVALHLYYDGKPGGPTVSTQIRTILETATLAASVRGEPVEMWVTEHGRWPEGDASDPNWKARWSKTNDMEGVIGTADFLIGISQVPDVAGAMLHGLRAGPWNMFEMENGVPQLSGVGHLFDFLGRSNAGARLVAQTASRNEAEYGGGYDVRGTAFRDESGENIVVWVVSRAPSAVKLHVELPPAVGFSGEVNGKSLICVRAPTECRGRDFRSISMKTNQFAMGAGGVDVSLPARSVSVLKFRVMQ